jgi:hypothetical protein
MTEFCVFFYDQRYQKYYVYYHHLNKYVETYDMPDTCDRFEYSKLTKRSINEQSKNGIEIKDLLITYANDTLFWRNELLTSKKLKKKYDHFASFNKSDGTKFLNTNESNVCGD